MSNLIGNAVVGQSGGPTAAINATLAGVIRGAKEASKKGIIKSLYGMKNGIDGFLKEDFVDLFAAFDCENKLQLLESTPSAALGSCRRKMKSPKDDPEIYQRVFDIIRKYNIRYFFYIGGNDSMDTVLKLSEFAKKQDYELRVIGVPKTIDNDLMATDHTPGFGSAAKYVAVTMKEILRDISVYDMKAVTIVEIMGRDAGWLTAASGLTKLSGGISPDLIYLPECDFDPEAFLRSIVKIQQEHPAVLVAVSEGIRFADGRYVGEGLGGRKIDAFGHVALSGAGKILEQLVKDRLGCKVRSIELNLPQRCSSHISSATDISESSGVGFASVRVATSGKTGVMMTIERLPGDDYMVSFGSADIAHIANGVKKVPREYINSEGNGITDECINYLAPLIIGEPKIEYENGLPKHIVL